MIGYFQLCVICVSWGLVVARAEHETWFGLVKLPQVILDDDNKSCDV